MSSGLSQAPGLAWGGRKPSWWSVLLLLLAKVSLVTKPARLTRSPQTMAAERPHLRGSEVPLRGAGHLPQEEDTLRVHDRHQERPVEHHQLRAQSGRPEPQHHARGCGRLGPRLVHLHHGFVHHLQGDNAHQLTGLGEAGPRAEPPLASLSKAPQNRA